MLAAAPGRPADLAGVVDERVHELERGRRGGVYGVWSFMLLKEPRPDDVVCVASHGARVMVEYARNVRLKGVIANDAGGFGLDRPGADGLPLLDQQAIAGATVLTTSARLEGLAERPPCCTGRSG